MESDESREIRREYAGGDVRFGFPVRPLGKLKLFGLFLIGFSVLFIWGPTKGVFETIARLHKTEQAPFEYVALTGQIFFVVVGCFPACLGLLIMFGRCRVEWKEGQLRTTEILGPFRWTRRLRKPIRKFKVDFAREAETDKPVIEGPFGRLGVLIAEFEQGKSRIIALGYPRDWLLGVAHELKGHVGGSAFLASPQVEMVDASPLNENDADVFDPPAGSRVQMTEQVNGFRLTVPAAVLWRGSKGFILFPLFWCAVVGAITTVALLPNTKREASWWIIIPVFSLFWGIGLGLLAFAFNLGRRTATLEVGGGQLRVETIGIFGTKHREWRREEITAIRADHSGMKINNRPVIELQIHPRTGKKVGLLSGRGENELRWMATRLRGALNVPARNN